MYLYRALSLSTRVSANETLLPSISSLPWLGMGAAEEDQEVVTHCQAQ